MSNAKTNPLIQEADKQKNEGNHNEAIRICERILANDLNCVEAFEEIGDNYLSLRKYDKAEKALRQAIKLNRESANANYLLGFVYSCTGEWNLSLIHISEPTRRTPISYAVFC